MSYHEYYKKYLAFVKDPNLNKTGVEITYDKENNPKVVAKSEKFQLTLPKYQEYDKVIENLSKEIEELGKQYKQQCSQMYLADNITQKDVHEFEKVSGRLRDSQRKLQVLQAEKGDHQLRHQQNARMIEHQFEEYDNRQRTLYETIDQGEPERISALLIKNQKEFQPLEKRRLLGLVQRMQYAPIYKTIQEGEVIVNGHQVVVKAPPSVPVVVDKKTHELKKTMKKTIVKDILNDPEFKFSSVEECISRKRLAKHYMSKEEILEVINGREDILQKMPKGYKTLTKEALCQLIFSS